MKFRDLETVRSIIKDSIGLEIAYAYDDLVFVEHGVIIIQFNDTNTGQLSCYFHEDCILEEQNKLLQCITTVANTKGIDILLSGKFSLEQKDNNEEINIHFK